MPDIIIVSVEGLKETKMTIPHMVLREGLNVVRPVPFNARWWDGDSVDLDDVMPVETVTCYDAGFAMKGRIVMAPREWIAKWEASPKPELSTSPSKVMDLDTELTDDEFDLDNDEPVSFEEFWFGLADIWNQAAESSLSARILKFGSITPNNKPKLIIDPDIS